MSVASDLQAAFAEKALTCPVTNGDESTRGFFDHSGALQKLADMEMPVHTTAFYVQRGTLPLARGDELTIGALGADSAVGGTRYHINDSQPVDDGEIIAIALGGAA